MPSNTSWFFHYSNVNQGGDAPSSSCELFLIMMQTADCHDVNHHSWLPPSKTHLWDISTGANPASFTTWLPYAQLIHLPAAPPGIQHNPASTHPLFNQNKDPALFSEGKGGGGVLTKLSTGHAPLSFRSMVSLPLAGCCGKSRCSSLLRVVCWAMAVGCPADLGVWGQVLLTTVVCLRGKRVLARREGLAFLVD